MAGGAGAFACQPHRNRRPLSWPCSSSGWALAGGLHHPDYLSYFNELVGGQPEKVLVDSDLDWRQDAKTSGPAPQRSGCYPGFLRPIHLEAQCLDVWPGLPHPQVIDPLVPVEGWTAVSPTLAKTTQYGMDYRFPNLQPWFEYIQPVERVGSLLLYYVPPGSLRQAR